MTELAYRIVDVFADKAFAGNPLAVVLDPGDLSQAQLQSIAVEFNLSETTFVTTPGSAGGDYTVRIFTPGAELPFAGHPSVGTAWVLHDLGRIRAGIVRQECGIGVVELDVDAAGAELSAPPISVGPELDPAPLLDAVGLGMADAAPGAAPRTASAGIEFTVLPLVSREAVDRASPDQPGLTGLGEVLLLHWADGVAYARMFARDLGVREDPATGSAALAFGAWLAASGLVPPDGETPYRVEQGVRMGRPSQLFGRVEVSGGVATMCRVRGGVVPVAEGRIRIPAP